MIRLYYIFKLILRGLRLRPWGSLLTLIACWFALCELSLLLYAVDIADRASVMPATSGSMIAYLREGTSQTRIAELGKTLRAIGEVSHVQFVSRQLGLERMKKWLGPDSSMVEGVDPGILPDAFEITLKREYGPQVDSIAGKVSKIPGLDDVRYHRGLIGYIAGSYTMIALSASLIAAIVVVCLSLVIFLSIRVGIVSRRQEIEVLSLLGAQYLFIYAPYLIEAGSYGLLGSGASLVTASAAVTYLHAHFPALQPLIRPLGITQVAGVLFFACLCSVFGALLAIKRNIYV
jgi:cell division transport system permease protein